MIPPLCVTLPLVLLGIGASVAYGVKACEVFQVDCAGKPLAWKVHQFWFNFAGSVFGWAALWLFVRNAWMYFTPGVAFDLGASDWALVIFALVGITGHLPYAVGGVLEGLKALALKVAGLLK